MSKGAAGWVASIACGPFLRGAELAYNTSKAADVLRTRHIGDFANWKDHDAYQKAFERLLRDLSGKRSGWRLSQASRLGERILPPPSLSCVHAET
jgi:hypothetical protein